MPNDQVQIDNAECNENARVEYAAANDTYMHYDNFSWQVGSVLLAGDPVGEQSTHLPDNVHLALIH